MEACWQWDATQRPTFRDLAVSLRAALASAGAKIIMAWVCSDFSPSSLLFVADAPPDADADGLQHLALLAVK
jgi:hypothetical protein